MSTTGRFAAVVKCWSCALTLAGAWVATDPVQAVVGATDSVPAATLLLPYFEVDLEEAEGVNTVLSINNASSVAVLAHVVVWSDLSVPVLDFNVYLTGYDVQQVSMRELLNGHLPQTAAVAQDIGDQISPQGLFSQDLAFPSCGGLLPPPELPTSYVDHLRRSLTGKSSPILSDGCAGRDLGDAIARGYVTVDVVSNCSLRFPGDPGYFISGGLGDATNQNVLWGDSIRVDPAQNFASGDTLVHIEASSSDLETSVPGQYTFYGRYVAWNASDNREPLATQFAVRYLNGGAFDGGSELLVWRDSKVAQGPFPCGTVPPWYRLGSDIVVFDEFENPEVPETFPVSPQPPENPFVPFGAEAQRTAVGGDSLPTSSDYGWLFLDLNTNVVPAGAVPPEDPLAAQAWVSVTMDAEGRYSVGFSAVQLDSAVAASHAPVGD